MTEGGGIARETERMTKTDCLNLDVVTITVGAEVVTATAATDLRIGENGIGSRHGVAVEAGAPRESVNVSESESTSAKTGIIAILRLGGREVEA